MSELQERGFKFVALPPIGADVLASYEEIELDPYMAHGTRYKRFSQYRLTYSGDEGWQFELLPHRAYSAFKKFNNVAGGILREYTPIAVDFVSTIKHIVDQERFLDQTVDWQINVHQNRSKTTTDKSAELTPEGIHQDGHEFVIISILSRNNVRGGEMRLWPAKDADPIWRGTLAAGDAVILDDQRVYHDVTPIEPDGSTTGTRDILIVSFSRWDERWYGEEHEQAVLSDVS
ncbi:2OG-Fe dioxygenase family protein [Nocardia sp. NPDC052316]|uniref:2OG-Fe dioxygenase family protein n=1 Tax=Nocardia sp. NPDC052316 TaxID=3364329 RepID=UPI0037CC0E67